MTADPTPTTMQAGGDRLSPLFSLSADERTLARQRYAENPAPFEALISNVLALLDYGERVCDHLAEQAAGRTGA